MKLYVVFYGGYEEESCLYGIYSNLKVAEKKAKECGGAVYMKENGDVPELDVDFKRFLWAGEK